MFSLQRQIAAGWNWSHRLRHTLFGCSLFARNLEESGGAADVYLSFSGGANKGRHQ
jgi:hypothetical protein